MIHYYGELCTKMYESDKSMADGVELEFYLSCLKGKNMKVLEPMCGNGRMLIPFMQKGIDIEGFDLSEEMLKVCVEKGKNLNLRPVVFHEKIEEFKNDKKYDQIMIPFGSFSLLPDMLVRDSLLNMKSALADDGKLLLTVVIKNSSIKEIPDWIETNRKPFENEMIVEYQKVQYDEKRKLLFTQLKYQSLREGLLEKTEIMDSPVRLYYLEEFEHLLEGNGFKNIIIHEVINDYGEGSSFHVFECGI